VFVSLSEHLVFLSNCLSSQKEEFFLKARSTSWIPQEHVLGKDFKGKEGENGNSMDALE
jgi:hypothetical protein